MPKPRPPTLHKPRNPIATNPLLRKGGTHEKPATAKRRQARREVELAVEELRGGEGKAGEKRGRS